MRKNYGKLKQMWKEYESLVFALAYEILMIIAVYYAFMGRYVYRECIVSKRFAILSLICGFMAMINLFSFDYYQLVIRKGKSHGGR